MTTLTKSAPVEIVAPEGTTGRAIRDQFHVAAAYRAGHRIELSGQTGHRVDLSLPESIQDEITQAFVNVTEVLEAAGAGWEDVFAVRTYHTIPAGASTIDGEAIEAVIATFATLMPNHYSVWTAIGVPALAFEGQRFEVEITANA
ncbi:Rid family hydrolase [Microbacterium sp. LWH3-1.2]|uniref:Rid family hydrolase n=1 Tax=Microbacterium sp. LWH3-1.2 TaxID=3135256 RepID=UPI003425201C